MTYVFKPVWDIDGYIFGLKREGFLTDCQIEDVRRKHQDAKDLVEKQAADKATERKFKLMNQAVRQFCNFNCDTTLTQVKMKVSTDKVRIKIVVPFAELETWVQEFDSKKPPKPLMLKCLKTAGASREFLENLIKGEV